MMDILEFHMKIIFDSLQLCLMDVRLCDSGFVYAVIDLFLR